MTSTTVTNRYLRNAMLWLESPAEPLPGPPNGEPQKPYLGPQEYETADQWRFFGRQREQTQLRQLLIAERVVLLYSPSGAGKTSLIKAALIPDLVESDELNVLPVMRVGREPDAFQQTLPEEVADLTFAEFLDRREAAFGNDNPTVLIFDQFEELLTTDATDDAGRREFLSQVGTALRDRNRCALFAMREEYEPRLDPYRRYIPNRWSVKLRLDLLTTEAAKTAIQRPAALFNVEFTDEAALKLVDDLSEIQVSSDDSLIMMPGQYVEPVQLQVACLSVWNNREPGTTRIDEESINLAGGVSQALTGYYDQSVAKVARDTRVSERDIRRWADRELITPLGVRGQVLKEPKASRGLDNSAIWGLVDEYIVRKEERRGAIWFELAHDRLIEPVRTSNARWFQEHLNVLQRQAELWDERKRPKDLLLRGAALKEAKRWRNERPNELTANEAALLDQSRRSERRAWITGLVAIGTLVGLFLLAYLIWSGERDRVQSANEALASERITNALLLGDRQLDTALLLGGASTSLTDSPLLATTGGLMGVISESPISGFLRGHTAPVENVVVSPDGGTLASSDSTGAVLLWDAETLQGLGTRLSVPEPWGINDLAFSPDSSRLAVADSGGNVWVWSVLDGVATGEPLIYPDSTDSPVTAQSVAFDPGVEGRHMLAVGYDNGSIVIWNVDDPENTYELRGHKRTGHEAPEGPVETAVIDLAYTPEGNYLLSAGEDGRVIRWDLYDGNRDRYGIVGYEHQGIAAFAMNRDGSAIATATDDGTVNFWDVETGMALEDPLLLNTGIQELSFSRDGTDLVICGPERGFIRWDRITDRFLAAPAGYALTSCSAAFLEINGRTLLLTGSATGPIVAWNETSAPANNTTAVQAPPERLAVSIAFSQDGATLVLASLDGTLERWTIDASALGATWQTEVALQNFPAPGPANDIIVNAMVLNRHGDQVAASFCLPVRKEPCQTSAIYIWDARTGALINQSLVGGTPLTTLVFSPDASRLASASDDGVVAIWDTTSLSPGEVYRLPPPDGGQTAGSQLVQSLAFSPDATILAIGGANWEITLWHISSDSSQTYSSHGGAVSALVFSNDGARLASGGQDGNIITWIVEGSSSAASIESTASHGSPVTALAFTRDGLMLASAASDWSVILWDRETGLAVTSQVAPHDESSNAPISLAFSLDGHRLAASGGVIGARNREAASVTIWDASATSLTATACQIAGRNLETQEWTSHFPGKPYEKTCLDGVLNDALGHIMNGDTEAARSAFAQAVDLAAGSAEQSNMTCLLGAIEGFADTIMPACDRAVNSGSNNGHYLDSRAIARATLGDLTGAATDLRRATEWMTGVGVEQSIVELRLSWLAALEAGENPLASVASDLRLHRQALALASASWTTFASPIYRYSISWNGDWRLGHLSSLDGTETLSLLGSDTAVIVTASPSENLVSCAAGGVKILGELLRAGVVASNADLSRLGAPSWPAGEGLEWELHAFTQDDGGPDLVVFFGCRTLDPSTTLRVIAVIPADAYDEQLPLIEELISNIRITASELLGGIPGHIQTLDELIDSIFQGPRPDGSILAGSLSPLPVASPQATPAATPGATPLASPVGAGVNATPVVEDSP